MERLCLDPKEAILDLKTGKIYRPRDFAVLDPQTKETLGMYSDESITAWPWLVVVKCYRADHGDEITLEDEGNIPAIVVPVTAQGTVDYKGLAVFQASLVTVCRTNELVTALAGTATLQYKEFRSECFRRPGTEKAEDFCVHYHATTGVIRAEAEKLLARVFSGLLFEPDNTYQPGYEFWEPLGMLPQADGYIYKLIDGIARRRFKAAEFNCSWKLEDVLPPGAYTLAPNAYITRTLKNRSVAWMLAPNGKRAVCIIMDVGLMARIVSNDGDGRKLLLRALRLRLLSCRNQKRIEQLMDNPSPAADSVQVGLAEVLAAGACFAGILKVQTGVMEGATNVSGKILKGMIRSHRFSYMEREFALRALAIATLAAGKRHGAGNT